MEIPKQVKKLYGVIWDFLEEKSELPAKKNGKLFFTVRINKKIINKKRYLSIKISRVDTYKLVSNEYKLDPAVLSEVINDIEDTELLINQDEWMTDGSYSIKSSSNDGTTRYHYWYQMNLDHTDVLELHNIVNLRIDIPEKPTIKNHVKESSIKSMEDTKYSKLVYHIYSFIRRLLIDLIISFINQHIA